MLGQRLESRRGFPVSAVIWFTLAIAFAVVGAVVHNPHPAIFAALPAAIAIALLLGRERPFDALVTAEGLEIEGTPLSLPYRAIEGIVRLGKGPRAPIQIVHAGGVVRIPASLNVGADDLFAFLLEQIPRSGSRDLPGPLKKYCAVQEAHFGSERVFSFRSRPPHRALVRRRTAIIVSLGISGAGLVWLVFGILLPKHGEPWIAFGILFAVFAALCALAFRFESVGPRIKNWQEAGLVISPEGLALFQGDIRGELRWDELRDIRYRTRGPFFQFQASGAQFVGIHLVVEGATITVADLYDRPLAVIHQRMKAYWLGGGDRA